MSYVINIYICSQSLFYKLIIFCLKISLKNTNIKFQFLKLSNHGKCLNGLLVEVFYKRLCTLLQTYDDYFFN